MYLRYVITQGWRLLRGNRLQTMLLIVCYACGVLIPMSILSYRQGVLNVRNADDIPFYDYMITPIGTTAEVFITDEAFQKLIDYREIADFLSAVGEGTQMALLSADIHETAVYLDGHILKGMILWRLPSDDAGYVLNTLDTFPHLGRSLSSRNPYEVMLGDRLLRGMGDPASFIGKELMLYGTKYTVCGIVQGTGDIYGNMLSRNHMIFPIINFRVPERSDDLRRRLSNELEDRFSIHNLLEVTTSGTSNYDIEMDRQISDMLFIALLGFGFCIINSFGILNSFLADNREKVFVKLTMGAKRRYIFSELMIFWFLIVLSGSLLAFAALFGVREYMALFFHHRLDIGWQLTLLLPLAGLVTAALASLYSVFGIARRLA
jgi:hypothetical protein